MQRFTLKMEAEFLSGSSENFYYIARRNITCEITFMLKIWRTLKRAFNAIMLYPVTTLRSWIMVQYPSPQKIWHWKQQQEILCRICVYISVSKISFRERFFTSSNSLGGVVSFSDTAWDVVTWDRTW